MVRKKGPEPAPTQLIWVVTHCRALVGVLTWNCARAELTAAATARREKKVFMVVKWNSDGDSGEDEHEQ
jgi:hypothetical protein